MAVLTGCFIAIVITLTLAFLWIGAALTGLNETSTPKPPVNIERPVIECGCNEKDG